MAENTSQETPTLAAVISEAIEAKLYDTHTLLPGRIVDYDPGTQTASVQPLIKRQYLNDDGTVDSVALPIIPDVPVVFPRGGGFFISFPLKANDSVELRFSERSLEEWHDRGGLVDPVDRRRHNLSDVVASPAMYPLPDALDNAHADDLVIGRDNGASEMHLTPAGDLWLKAGNISLGAQTLTSFVALAEKVLAELTAIQTQFNSHTHVCAAPGSPSAPPLPAMLAPSSVASSKVKVTT